MAQQWEVESTTGRCTISGRELEEGETFYTVLFEDGDSFRRTDYTVDVWEGPPEGAFCHFKTRVPVKAKRKKLLVDNELLVSFFVRLADETEPVRIQFRFVLALILMRKRLLRYVGSETLDEVEVWRMVVPVEQTEHKVVNPHLTDGQIEGVSGQLSAILHGDMGEWAVMDDESDSPDIEGSEKPDGTE
jgi:hypothetical protein